MHSTVFPLKKSPGSKLGLELQQLPQSLHYPQLKCQEFKQWPQAVCSFLALSSSFVSHQSLGPHSTQKAYQRTLKIHFLREEKSLIFHPHSSAPSCNVHWFSAYSVFPITYTTQKELTFSDEASFQTFSKPDWTQVMRALRKLNNREKNKVREAEHLRGDIHCT